MYVPDYSTSARQLDMYVETKVDKKEELKKKKLVKVKNTRRKMALYMVCGFALMFFVLLRYIQVYDLHSQVSSQKKNLETLQMENDQTRLNIESMTDNKKIQEYAETELGLKKMSDTQIVYLNPHKETYMVNLENGKSYGTSQEVHGSFAGYMEYLN